MGVRLVGEDEIAEAQMKLEGVSAARQTALTEPERTEVPTAPKPPGPSREAIMMELITQASRILGFRLQLFAAFLASAGLSVYAVQQTSYIPLVVVGLYNLMVLAPMIFLAYRRG